MHIGSATPLYEVNIVYAIITFEKIKGSCRLCCPTVDSHVSPPLSLIKPCVASGLPFRLSLVVSGQPRGVCLQKYTCCLCPLLCCAALSFCFLQLLPAFLGCVYWEGIYSTMSGPSDWMQWPFHHSVSITENNTWHKMTMCTQLRKEGKKTFGFSVMNSACCLPSLILPYTQ